MVVYGIWVGETANLENRRYIAIRKAALNDIALRKAAPLNYEPVYYFPPDYQYPMTEAGEISIDGDVNLIPECFSLND